MTKDSIVVKTLRGNGSFDVITLECDFPTLKDVNFRSKGRNSCSIGDHYSIMGYGSLLANELTHIYIHLYPLLHTSPRNRIFQFLVQS